MNINYVKKRKKEQHRFFVPKIEFKKRNKSESKYFFMLDNIITEKEFIWGSTGPRLIKNYYSGNIYLYGEVEDPVFY